MSTSQIVRDRRLTALARLVELLSIRVPHAIDVLQQSTAYSDGWPTRGDDPHVHTSGHNSSVESVAIAVDEARREIGQVYDDIDTITVMVHDHLRMIDRIIARQPKEKLEPKLCDPRGRDGSDLPWTSGVALEEGNGWSDPTCRNVASRGSLCDACSRREHRWRAHRNLPARKDGVYSQPGPTEDAYV